MFNGLINVAQHAIKTDGQMTNNNLLLGRPGRSGRKPQLRSMPTTSNAATAPRSAH